MSYEQDVPFHRQHGTVNSQITDSVTQTMAHVVGHSPSETKSMLDTLMAETVGMAMYNAVTNQHNAQMVSNATVIAACARMLKSPIVIPSPTPVVAPVILSVTPSPIPANEANLVVQVVGAGFAPGLSVTIMLDDGTVVAMIGGAAQITAATFPNAFSFTTDLLSSPGKYKLRVQNAPGLLGAPAFSANFPIVVAMASPLVNKIKPDAGSKGEYFVSGNYFDPNIKVSVVDENQKPLAQAATVNYVQSDMITISLPSLANQMASEDAPSYTAIFTNPGAPPTSKNFAISSVALPVTTVYEAASPAKPAAFHSSAPSAASPDPCAPEVIPPCS
jgi:hypothetical protein